MPTLTVTNLEQNAAGFTRSSQISASKPADRPSGWVITLSMLAVAGATTLMWFAYRDWIKPPVIKIQANYVPYAGVIAVTAALERLLEPLSNLLMQGDPDKNDPKASQAKGISKLASSAGRALRQATARQPTLKQAAAKSILEAKAAAANPKVGALEVTRKLNKAVADQASAEGLRSNRSIFFWAIASICGVGLSGGFGIFLLQSIASTNVNHVLDLAVTGLTIGAGTKPTHDLISSLQAKSASSAQPSS